MLAVTGITGHTGTFFLNQLMQNKYEGKIKCLVRSAERAAYLNNSGLNIELIEGDLDNEESIRKLLTDATVVVHIANIHYSPRILKIGYACGVQRFVLVHTTGIYSKHKVASESYIRIENEIIPLLKSHNITILRPTMIFGDMKDHNISKFIRLVDRIPLLPVVSGGNALIQPVNARDLGRALYQVLYNENTFGKAYDLSGQRALSIKQLYLLIAAILGKKRMIISFPEKICVWIAKILRVVSAGKVDLVEKVQRMGENRSYSHQDAMRDFDYSPELFETGLSREVREYLSSR